MSKKNILIAVILMILFGLGSLALYIFFKPHRSIEYEATVTVSADSLMAAYTRDETSANTLYLDKALVVSGEIAELKTNQAGQTVVILKTGDPISGIVCTIKEKPAKPLQIGQQVLIKGFCSGFIADVVLRDCQIMLK
jgi:tRNA_anti-like